MNLGELLYASNREEWREWLEANHRGKTEIWLVSYRKGTGRPTVAYNDAVEEALCYGWIDSTRKTIDADRYAQRFTPRRAGSVYSQANRERLARLSAEGKLLPSVETELDRARPEAFEIPADIRAALEAHDGAWEFFSTRSPAYQRIRAAYVDHARKRPDEFEKRLANLVRKSAEGVQFGFGIEDYY